MTKYDYHNLYPQHFERLVVCLCSEILGSGVRSFSAGPDGGCDGWFNGTAQKFPSASDPWSGKFLIQSKHTSGINAKFSDRDFSGETKTSVISKEIPKIKKFIKENGEVDYYLLFSNRKLASNASFEITSRIQNDTGIKNVHLIGIEDLERLLKENPVVSKNADINPIDTPLTVSSDDLAYIISSFSKQLPTIIKEGLDLEKPIERISLVQKNENNRLSEGYHNKIVKDIENFWEIKRFLSLPDNANFLEMYENVVAEFEHKITAYRADFDTFDKVIIHIFDILTKQDPDLSKKKILTFRMLHYMYWNCDIGVPPDVETH
ncbi:MAG: ABC-three component system protein [Vampirovibrionales bacterium]